MFKEQQKKELFTIYQGTCNIDTSLVNIDNSLKTLEKLMLDVQPIKEQLAKTLMEYSRLKSMLPDIEEQVLKH